MTDAQQMTDATDSAPTQASAQMDMVWLGGLTDYGTAWALQRRVHAEVVAQRRPDTLLLLQHPHTLTMGRRGGWAHLRATQAELDAAQVERWQIDRGGDVTYHGPGQLVGYPIVNLQRAGLLIGPLVRAVEQASIDLLASYGVEAARQGEFPGVWCGDDKVTAVGMRVSAWTSLHGFALNVATDLRAFGHILPCGLVGKGVTSMRAQGVAGAGIDEVARRMGPLVAGCLGLSGRWVEAADLPWPDPAEVEALRTAHLLRLDVSSPSPEPSLEPARDLP
jgi:lipoyl(octanoyl) transferase